MARHALTPTRSDIPSALPTTLVAPTGGWNARDAIANMPITDAEIMDNWFPEATDVRTRTGSSYYASALPLQVETLFSYANGNTLALLCASGGCIHNITTVQSAGTINALSTIGSGFLNNRWQYTNIGTPGGSFLIACNGADNNQIYDGSIMYSQTVFSSGATVGFQASNVTIYNRRVFYTKATSLKFYYHEQVNAIGGTVSPFDLSGLMPQGGYLVGVDTWTRDAGAGPDDYVAFISSRGEVAVYVGTDPGNASNWSMVGVYKIPAPLGPRCTQKFGGDLLILTENGAYPLSAAVSGPLQQDSAITDKIRNRVAESVSIYRGNFGWELRYYPAGHWLVLNVPKATGTSTDQYVMNTNTGAWCRFTGLIANCFCVHNNNIYFGSNGTVIQANVNVGNSTAGGDNGNVINVDIKQAASTFGLPGRLKHFKLFKPQIASDGDLPITMGIDTDFSTAVPTNIPSPITVPYSLWDVSFWDTFYWADDPYPQPQWQGVNGIGTYAQVRMTGQVLSENIRWYSTDIIYEPGGMV